MTKYIASIIIAIVCISPVIGQEVKTLSRDDFNVLKSISNDLQALQRRLDKVLGNVDTFKGSVNNFPKHGEVKNGFTYDASRNVWWRDVGQRQPVRPVRNVIRGVTNCVGGNWP